MKNVLHYCRKNMLHCLWPQTYCSSSGTLGSEAMWPVLDIYQVLPMRSDSFTQRFCLPYSWLQLQTDKVYDKILTVPCDLEQFCFSSCAFYIGTSLIFMGFFLWVKNLPTLALISNHFCLNYSFSCQKTSSCLPKEYFST